MTFDRWTQQNCNLALWLANPPDADRPSGVSCTKRIVGLMVVVHDTCCHLACSGQTGVIFTRSPADSRLESVSQKRQRKALISDVFLKHVSPVLVSQGQSHMTISFSYKRACSQTLTQQNNDDLCIPVTMWWSTVPYSLGKTMTKKPLVQTGLRITQPQPVIYSPIIPPFWKHVHITFDPKIPRIKQG